MGLGKRLWEVARANVNDFARAIIDPDPDPVESPEAEESTVGARAGRRVGQTARQFRDRAEEAWERAFEAAQARAKRGEGSRLDVAAARLRWFATLEVPPGTPPEEVRRAYRRLMRQYHPDRFAGDPDKLRAATEITRKLTEAYNGLKGLSEA